MAVARVNTIWLHRITNPLDPIGSRVTEEVAWRRGMRARDVVPEPSRLYVNGRHVDADELLSSGCHLTAVGRAGDPATLAWLADFVINAVVAAAVGFLVSKLIGLPKNSSKPNDNESATYGWSGISTNYNANGMAIPVVLGEHLVGGLVIGQWVEAQLQTDTSGVIIDQKSVLRLLLLLGHGPVYEVGGYTSDQDNLTGSALPTGLKINDNAAENFQGVKAHVRLGSLNQTAIPGFDALRLMHVVGLLIDNVRSGTPVTDWSLAAAFDLTDEADQAVVGIAFPFGLFNLSGSSLATEQVIIEARYVELDGGGSPTGSWVVPAFFDDGSANPITISGKIQGEMVRQLPLTFYDPATYVPQSAGQAVLCRKTKGFLRRANLAGANVAYSDGVDLDAFSIEIFYHYVQGLSGSSGRERCIFGWCYWAGSSVPTNGSYDLAGDVLQGIACKWTDGNASGSIDDVGLEIELGAGGLSGAANQGHTNGWQRFVVPSLFNVSNGAHKFGQLVLTYEKVGSIRTLKVYHDGVQVFTRTDTAGAGSGGANGIPIVKTPPSFSSTGKRFHLGSAHQMTGFASGLIFDQTRIWKRVLTPSQVASSWASGVPVGGALSGAMAQSLVAFWSLNTSTLSGQTGSGTVSTPWHTGTYADSSGNGLDIDIVDLLAGAGGVEEQTGFVLDGAAVATPKKARYRIQVQRRDLVRDGTTVRDLCKLDHVITVEDTGLQYPTRALLGIEITADEQLNTNRPNVTVPMKGLLCPHWDGIDNAHPNAAMLWSANPARCAALAFTAKWGLGRKYTLANLDLQSFEDWASWCNEQVWDQRDVLPVHTINYGTWPSGSALDTLYPDGYLEIVGDFNSVADVLPGQLVVGYPIKLTGTAGGTAPSWAATILDGGPYTIAEVGLTTTFAGDTIRVPWPVSLVAVPPSPTSWAMSSTSSDVDAEGREPRMRCDIVLDRRTERAWDQIMKLFSTGRAVPVKVGDRFRAKWERARQPVQLFSSANIHPGSFKFSLKSAEEEFNAATMEILDRDQGYRREPVALQHDSLRDASVAQNVREKGFTAEGVTRRSQAMRELRFLLNTARVLKMVVEFKTGAEGAFVEVGDVVLVAHDLPLWAFSGRCRDDSADASRIILDRPLTLAAATSYICVVRNGQGDAVEWVDVASPAGDYEPGDVIELASPLAAIPARDDLWAIGTHLQATKAFQIIHTGLGGELRRVIRVVEYNPDVYDEDGFAQLPPARSELVVPKAGTTPGAPLTILAGDGSGTDDDLGVYRKRLDLSWQYDPDDLPSISGAAIWIGEEPTDGSAPAEYVQVGTVLGRTSSYRLSATDLKVGTSYRVKVQPIGRDGSRVDLRRLPGSLVRMAGRSSSVSAPSSVATIQAGDQVGYVVQQGSAGIASSVELRRGGYILGDRVATLGVQADLGAFSQNWVALPTAADGRSNPPLFARNVFTNLQRSPTYEIGFEPDLTGFEAVLASGSIEDAGWTAGSPAPVLTDMAVDTAFTPDIVEFTGSALGGQYQSTDIVLSEARLVHLSLGWEAEQIHPRTWGELEELAGGSLIVELEQSATPLDAGQVQGRVVGGRVPAGGWHDAWDSVLNRSWTWEGPTDNLGDDVARKLTGNVSIRVQIAFSTTTSPGSNWITYSPGYYYLRSFRVLITFLRHDATYDVRLSRLAYALRARVQDVIDGGDIG